MHYCEQNFPELVLASGEHAGFRWLVVSNKLGHRCGYIRVPAEHPWHEQDYDGIDADCHGGLTYASPGTDKDWWIGFDCAHLGDAPDPALVGPDGYLMPSGGEDRIRTQEYVEAECKKLCEQAAKAQAALA